MTIKYVHKNMRWIIKQLTTKDLLKKYLSVGNRNINVDKREQRGINLLYVFFMKLTYFNIEKMMLIFVLKRRSMTRFCSVNTGLGLWGTYLSKQQHFLYRCITLNLNNVELHLWLCKHAHHICIERVFIFQINKG